MRGESMKGKSKKSTYSTTFGVDPNDPSHNIYYITPSNEKCHDDGTGNE